MQYHWHNRGYESFDDWLATLHSRKRKQIRKERKTLREQGYSFRLYRGEEITEEMLAIWMRHYESTSSRKWGQPYLTKQFFQKIFRDYDQSSILITAWKNQQWIASALNFVSNTTLYGRNWGCDFPERFLHFETCYYQAIDYAIAHRLSRVEAGVQGEHKLFRGYEPTPCWSAHDVSDQRFRHAIEEFCHNEALHNQAIETHAKSFLPYASR